MSSRERIQKALDSLLYLPHLQAQHSDEPSLPVASGPHGSGAAGSNGGKGRPWDRGDFFRRLATFRSSTWFCKPAVISPVECARRGWTNTTVDLLSCEFCKAKVSCPIPADLLPEQAEAAGQRYASKLTDAHDAACPWRTGSSSLSLLQFPPLTEEAVRRDFEGRCAALQRLACLPPVAAEPYEAFVAASSAERLSQLLLKGPQGRTQQQQQQLTTYLAAPSSAPSAAPTSAAAAGAAAGAALGGADAAASIGQGTAALGSLQFHARARLLALCGWDLKLMTAAAAAAPMPPPAPSAAADAAEPGTDSQHAQHAQHAQQQAQQAQQAQQELPSLVGPESAALLCSLCNAKAGLWTFFPQCKPLVLAAPKRRGTATAHSPSAAVTRTISRNVAADMRTTIAGGAMSAPPAAAAAQQPSAADAATSNSNGAGPFGSSSSAAAAPFGRGSLGTGGVPAFGFAALHAPKEAAAASEEAASGVRQAGTEMGAAVGTKRKHADFSWQAVMADIDAKDAAEKRSKAAAAANGSANGKAAAAAAATAAAAAASQPAVALPGGQQQQAAAAAMAGKYIGMQVTPLDPLALHRPFCPWVNNTQAGEKEGRCGWRWCLQQLAAPATSAALGVDEPSADGEGGDGERGGKGWDPAKLLRDVLQQVDVHK